MKKKMGWWVGALFGYNFFLKKECTFYFGLVFLYFSSSNTEPLSASDKCNYDISLFKSALLHEWTPETIFGKQHFYKQTPETVSDKF